MCKGGSVVLKTRAPARAIICVPRLHNKRFAVEHEALVDRRKLGRVDVLERFAELSLEEYERQTQAWREKTGRL